LTQNIQGFNQCTISSKLDKILNGVPKKKPQYLVFVNSQRKPRQGNEEEESAGKETPNIGIRRQALKGRKSKQTDETAAPKPPVNPRKTGRAPPDPKFAFVYTGGSRSMHRTILANSLKIKKSVNKTREIPDEEDETSNDVSDVDMAAAESALLEYEDVLSEREEDVVPDSAESMDKTDQEKCVLEDALSMPVVEWNDPD
jgi:hypothetical protein